MSMTDVYNPSSAFQQTDPAQATLAELMSQIGPQLGADATTQAGYQQQLGAVGAGVQSQDAYAQAMAGIQQGNLGISEQQLGIQGQGLAAQEGLSSQQQGIEQQQYGLQQQQYPEQQAEQALSYKNTVQAQQGNAAASGATNTEGNKQAVVTNAAQNQWANADINRAQQNAMLGQQSEQAGYQYQQGEYARSQENLGLMAQGNGLSEQQLQDQLAYGISQNQNSGVASAGQLLAQMGSLASGDISAAGTALAPIAYAGGVNPFTTGGSGIG